jgi:hypothetical protein
MTWDTKNRLTQDTVLFDAIGKIREQSDKRREIEARVLAENNLASVRQLSEDKKKKFCAIVDSILAEEKDVNTQLFTENGELSQAAAKVPVSLWNLSEAWTKADHNPEKNTTFLGAPKTNPNKGGYKGGAKPEKTKGGYTAMKRIKEDGIDEGIFVNPGKKKAEQRAWETGDKAGKYREQATASAKERAQGGSFARKALTKKADFLDRQSKRFHAVAAGKGMKFGTRKEEIIEAILEMEGLHSIDQLSESGLDKLEAIVEQVMIDEGYDLQEISLKGLSNYQNAADNDGDRALKQGNMARAKKRNAGWNTAERKRQSILAKADARDPLPKTGKFHSEEEAMVEDIVETILAMEGLHSVDQLSESGLDKLEAIVEQVLIDEGVRRPPLNNFVDDRAGDKHAHEVLATMKKLESKGHKLIGSSTESADDSGGTHHETRIEYTHAKHGVPYQHMVRTRARRHGTNIGTEKNGPVNEETGDLQEVSSQLLRRAADKAHGKGNMLSRTKGSKDPEVRARWGQSIKFAHAAASKEADATAKSIPSYRNLKGKLERGEKVRPKYEETMEEGWFSKKTPVEKENAMRRSIKKTDDSVQKHGAAYEKAASRTVRGALGLKQKYTPSGYRTDK